MRRYRLQHLLVVPLALLLLACFQRIDVIRAVDTTQGVAFESEEIEAGLKKGRLYELLDLTVMRLDCEGNCITWFLVRTGSSSASTSEGNLEKAQIVYGLKPKGMDARTQAKDLEPGGYSVSATVQEYGADGKLINSLSLDGEFSIYLDTSGNPRVARD